MAEFTSMKGTFPDGKRIRCKDCAYRDKAEVNIGGKTLYVGVTRDFCDKYKAPPDGNGKPHEVLFDNYDCPRYKKDDAG